MTEHAQVRRTDVSERALWFGVLAGPLAWLLHLGLSYPLVPLSCATEWGAVFHLISLVTALAAVAAATVAWQSWQQLRAEGPEGTVQYGRQGFMALAGLLKSILFLAVILAQWLPVLFISPCNYAP